MAAQQSWWNGLTQKARDDYEQVCIDDEDGTGRPPELDDIRAGRRADPRPPGKYLTSSDEQIRGGR